MDNNDYSHIEIITVPEHLVKPRKSTLDDALEDLGFVTTEWAETDPIADESFCDDEGHDEDNCLCN